MCRSEQEPICASVLQTNRLDPVLGMRARDQKMFFLRGRQNKRKPAKEREKKKEKSGKPKGRKGWQGVAYIVEWINNDASESLGNGLQKQNCFCTLFGEARSRVACMQMSRLQQPGNN